MTPSEKAAERIVTEFILEPRNQELYQKDEPEWTAHMAAIIDSELAAEREAIKKLRDAVEAISNLGGNMPDSNFESGFGENSARLWGGMIISAREIARSALAETKEGM